MRSRNYFGRSVTQATYVESNCVKEERLSLHIPADRLQAARFDGLSIAMLDRNGEDIPLYIPPNYVEGFLLANPYMRGSQGYSAPAGSTLPPTVQTYPYSGN